jgi:hypothetical protein
MTKFNVKKRKFRYLAATVMIILPLLLSFQNCKQTTLGEEAPSSQNSTTGTPTTLPNLNLQYKNSVTYTPTKYDILIIVDNSGSMNTSQQYLSANFEALLGRILVLGYDFRIAVQTTAAWQEGFGITTGGKKRFFKGGSHYVLDNNTPNLYSEFELNVKPGTLGTGDERAFASIYDTMTYAQNSDFRRSDAFLYILIVSDEDDYSTNTSTYAATCYYVYPNAPCNSETWNPANLPGLFSVTSYKTQFDGLFGAGKYSVNSVGIMDQTCLSYMNQGSLGLRLATRTMQLAELTGGKKLSICESNWAPMLSDLTSEIVANNSKQILPLTPKPDQIAVKMDGTELPNSTVNGWSLEPQSNTIKLNGSAIPAINQKVEILFNEQ